MLWDSRPTLGIEPTPMYFGPCPAARLTLTEVSKMACVCGHAEEEHGDDPDYPGSTACTECDCIAYEEEDSEEE